MYALIIFISLVACVMGLISEITACNITHIKNGRKPEAGASIFPTVPIIPILTLLLAWGLNRGRPSLGFHAVLILFAVFCVFWTISYRKARRELDRLGQKQSSEPGP